MKSRKINLKEVYVWEFPVRIFHWVNAFSILVLAVTGYLIGEPIAIQIGQEASSSYLFGWIRFIHFAAAFLFFFNFVMRIYWGFAGNKYAKWYNYIPHKKKQWQELWCVIKVDVFQIQSRHINSIGHNALADFIYFILFLFFLAISLTGFGLYAQMSEMWFPKLFEWVVVLLGGDLMTRQLHHIFMWFFIVFAMIHIYLVFYHDFIERRGVTSSMIGGWKFIEEDNIKEEGVEEEI